MKVYIVIIEDRHVDTTATPFACPAAAERHASTVMQGIDRHGLFEVEAIPPFTNWLWYATNGGDGAKAWIVPEEVRGA